MSACTAIPGEQVDVTCRIFSLNSRKKKADQNSAYHEAYKKAVQEGSDQEEAKGKAMAVPRFHHFLCKICKGSFFVILFRVHLSLRLFEAYMNNTLLMYDFDMQCGLFKSLEHVVGICFGLVSSANVVS